MDDNPTWPLYKRGLGPTSTELFMQSNFGIVTKMGYWLMPKPEVYMPLWLQLWDDARMPDVVDALRELMLAGTIDMRPQLSNTLCMASMLTARADWYDGAGPIPEEIIDRIAKELGLGRWMMRFALYGDEAVVDHNFAKLKRRFESIPDGRGRRVRSTAPTSGRRCPTRTSGCRLASRATTSTRWPAGPAARRAATSTSRRSSR